MEEKLVLSVRKALDILDILVFEDIHNKGVSLTKLSEKTGIKTNTLHNLLKTMIFCGYVQQNENLHYLAGKRCKQMGIINKFQITPEISEVLNEALYKLCSNTGESVSFYVLDNGDRISYTNIQSSDIIKVDYTMLEENSIYDYPSGKVLVANCDKDELKDIIEKHGYPHKYWNNISNMKQFEQEIEKARKLGCLHRISPDGKVASYAAPIFTNDNKLLGSAGVYMPAFRASEEKEKLIINELMKFAEYIKNNTMKR